MKTIGLTGGIGSGKSYIAAEFIKLGVPVFDADSQAKFIMASNDLVKKELINKWGDNAFLNDRLNKPFIAQQIFNNKDAITWINELVHPLVQQEFNAWRLRQSCHFVIKEAAILIESGAYQQCDMIILVIAPEPLRIERVMHRDGLTKQQVLERIQNQLSDIERRKFADFLINNDGTMVVSEEVQKIYTKIIANK